MQTGWASGGREISELNDVGSSTLAMATGSVSTGSAILLNPLPSFSEQPQHEQETRTHQWAGALLSGG